MKLGKQNNKENHHPAEQQREKNPGTGYYKGTDPGTEHQKNHKSDQEKIPAQIIKKRWEH